jgi:hypothetical protein
MSTIHYRKKCFIFCVLFFPFVSGARSPNLFLPFISYAALTSSCLCTQSPLRWRSAMIKPMKRREWRMEVLSLLKSASICPLKSPRRMFLLLRLDVVHHCCCASTFHDLPMATVEVDETWLVGPPPAWVRLVEPPPVEDSSGWALLTY